VKKNENKTAASIETSWPSRAEIFWGRNYLISLNCIWLYLSGGTWWNSKLFVIIFHLNCILWIYNISYSHNQIIKSEGMWYKKVTMY